MPLTNEEILRFVKSIEKKYIPGGSEYDKLLEEIKADRIKYGTLTFKDLHEPFTI